MNWQIFWEEGGETQQITIEGIWSDSQTRGGHGSWKKLSPEKFSVAKNFGSKNLGCLKIFGFKKFCVQKNTQVKRDLKVQNIFGQTK